MKMSVYWKNKTAIITGTTHGIGDKYAENRI